MCLLPEATNTNNNLDEELKYLSPFNMIYNKNSPTSTGSEMNCRFEHKCS